jgi:lipid A 3-O-deacylase
MAALPCKERRVRIRQIAGGLALVAALVSGGVASAQTSTIQAGASPVADAAVHANWNFGALVQSGFGVTEDRGSFKFLLVGGHAGRILTPQLGSGLFKGNFEYGVEVFPLWQSYTPKFQRISCTYPPLPSGATGPVCSEPYTVGGTFTGVSITPIILRWNFTHGERWMPWIQGAGGLVWTNHKYPAVGDLDPNDPNSVGPSSDTSVWNFTPQFGVGTHYFVRPRRSIDVSANAVHISSASLGDKNPGVNASVQFSVGYSWWK